MRSVFWNKLSDQYLWLVLCLLLSSANPRPLFHTIWWRVCDVGIEKSYSIPSGFCSFRVNPQIWSPVLLGDFCVSEFLVWTMIGLNVCNVYWRSCRKELFGLRGNLHSLSRHDYHRFIMRSQVYYAFNNLLACGDIYVCLNCLALRSI